MVATLLAGAVLALAAGAVYLAVGAVLGRRRVEGEASTAARLFQVWWFALGAATVLGGLQSAAANAGAADVGLFTGLLLVNLLLICVGLWGLLYYLLFLFTGRSSLLMPLSVFYLVYYTAVVVVILQADPVGVNVGRWSASLAYERPLAGPLTTVLLVLLVFPQIAGAIAYGSLYFRLSDRSQRFRVAVVSTSIVVWFSSSFVASAAGLGQLDWWQLTSRLIGLSAALSILLAYHPPRFLRARLGVESVAQPPRERAAEEPGRRAAGRAGSAAGVRS